MSPPNHSTWLTLAAMATSALCPGVSPASPAAPPPVPYMVPAGDGPPPNPADAPAVFARIFLRLPDEVFVAPSENYFYWRLPLPDLVLAGNIRLASGRRERGELAFGYSRWIENPDAADAPAPQSVFRAFTMADGVEVLNPGPFTCVVTFRGKKVTFRLHQIPQTPPKDFPLPPDEKFLARTWDESGLPFFLLYNTRDRHFLWVLNEESPVDEIFQPLPDAPGVSGARTGFAFWVDASRGNRKVLACVRRLSVRRNDYFDGPFDQLPDNHARQINLGAYIQEAFPALRGQVDEYGRYRFRSGRVALNSYASRDTVEEAAGFVREAAAAEDPRRHISRAGQ